MRPGRVHEWWGEPTAKRRRRKRQHVEVFHLDTDLSDGERWAVAEALKAEGEECRACEKHKLADRIMAEAERYQRCGKDAVLMECPSDLEQYFVLARCRSRICEPCGRIHKLDLQRQIKPLIQQVAANKKPGWGVAMLTLTVTTHRWGDTMPKLDDLRRFQKETFEFMRLFFGKWVAKRSRNGKVVEVRRPKKQLKEGEDPRVWKGAGWVGSLEFGADNNNAHGHFLVYGPFIDWNLLKSAWEKITGDSSGVFIRRLHSPKEAIDYVLKYVTKPPVTESFGRIAAYALAVKGTRRIRTGGIFFGKVRRRTQKRRCRCVHCGSALRSSLNTRPLEDCRHMLNLWEEYRRIEGHHRSREPARLPWRETASGKPADWGWLVSTTYTSQVATR